MRCSTWDRRLLRLRRRLQLRLRDLSITKTVDNATPSVGDTVNYTLTVSALGPATSTDVVATDTLPSGLTFENATSSVGNYASSTGTWTIGDLSASSTANRRNRGEVNAGRQVRRSRILRSSGRTLPRPTTILHEQFFVRIRYWYRRRVVRVIAGGGGTPTPATSTLTVNVSGLNASDTASSMVQDLTASTTQSTSTGNGSSTFVLNTNDQLCADRDDDEPELFGSDLNGLRRNARGERNVQRCLHSHELDSNNRCRYRDFEDG